MEPEIIELGGPKKSNLSLNPINVSFMDKKPSVNFGSGLELLMNDKRKNDSKQNSTDIDFADINDLENELNELSSKEFKSSSSGQSKSNMFKSMLGLGGGGGNSNKFNANGDNMDDRFSEGSIEDNNFDSKLIGSIKIGEETAKDVNENKTWDGFQKFNDIPVDPSKKITPQSMMSKEDLLREKFKFLRRLEELESKGVCIMNHCI